MAELACLRALVNGRVQGVFFRDFTRQHAEELGLTGYARNVPGGRQVEVVAEGGKKNLEVLADYLRVGPPAARVDSVETSWADYTGKYVAFTIAR